MHTHNSLLEVVLLLDEVRLRNKTLCKYQNGAGVFYWPLQVLFGSCTRQTLKIISKFALPKFLFSVVMDMLMTRLLYLKLRLGNDALQKTYLQKNHNELHSFLSYAFSCFLCLNLNWSMRSSSQLWHRCAGLNHIRLVFQSFMKILPVFLYFSLALHCLEQRYRLWTER